MIDPSTLIDSLVALLRDVPDLVMEVGGDPDRIYAYHDQYPKKASLALAVHQMPAPSIMAAWQGTAPGNFGGSDVWKHQVSLFLRARETFDGDPPTAYYRLFRLITKGVPESAGVPMINVTIHPSCYLKQMYKECADELAAAGLPIVLQFGETQWWYFPNPSGMPFYDDDTKAAFQARYGRPLHHFLANTDDPNDDIAAADFLRDRIWEYCAEVIGYVRRFHPAAVFECLWPLDANQGKPVPDLKFRALNFHVNLPNEWKTSSYGVKYFRAEGFDYDVWQKNARLMRQTLEFPLKLGRPASECMYLAGIYGPPDPPLREAYGMWRNRGLYSFCFWAFDQFCLNSRPVPLEVTSQATATLATYHRPRAARSPEAPVAVAYAPEPSSRMNTFRANARRLNA